MVTCSSLWRDQHGHIVAIHEADIIEIEPARTVQRELSESGGGSSTGTVAFDSARTAVGGGAGESAGGILGAISATPNAAGPWGRHDDGVGLTWL